MNTHKEDIEKLLKDAGVKHELIPLPEDLPLDVASHVQFHKIALKQAIPTLIYNTEKGLIAVQKRADTKINEENLKKLAEVTRLNFASPLELQKLGVRVGAVALAGLSLPHFIDRKVLENDEVYGGSGIKTFALKMHAKDLATVNKATIGDFTESEGKKRVYSGIRATGRLHLGNYLGAVKGMLALQDEYDCIFSVVDLHTITVPYNPSILQNSVRDIILDYLAAGLDPKRCILEIQSKVPQHTELAYLLSTIYPVSRLEDLPTYKDKKAQYPKYINMGLLYYPVLMAADVLLYKGELVPVGIDQEPHMEVMREIARKFNSMFSSTFPEPQRFKTVGEYVPSLAGSGKMSKSIEGSFITLTDDLETIRKRLAGAPTDSGQIGGDVPKQGGVANLFTLLKLFESQETYNKYVQDYRDKKIRYTDLKETLTQAVYKELQPFQERRKEFEKNPSLVDSIIEEGAEKAKILAKETMQEVKQKMGLW